jgi:hypothetical protein
MLTRDARSGNGEFGGRLERGVHESFNFRRAGLDAAVGRLLHRAEQFVGDIYRGNHRDANDVTGRKLTPSQIHAPVNERRKVRDVLRVQRTADSVALALDIDVDHAGL